MSTLSKIVTTRSTFFRVCDSKVLENGVKTPVIEGQLSHVGVISQNGYRYREPFWKTVFSNPQVTQKIDERTMLGMIEHPEDDDAYMSTPYKEASHVVLKAWVDSAGNPFGQFALLNNENGNALKALADLGVPIGVSTRGLGSSANDNVSEYVDENNYMLITWDCVKSPNFADLRMNRVTDSLRSNPIYKELVDAYKLRDSTDENYNKSSVLSEIKKQLTEIQNKLSTL